MGKWDMIFLVILKMNNQKPCQGTPGGAFVFMSLGEVKTSRYTIDNQHKINASATEQCISHYAPLSITEKTIKTINSIVAYYSVLPINFVPTFAKVVQTGAGVLTTETPNEK